MRFRTTYSLYYLFGNTERPALPVTVGPSMTIPDQTMSVKEIMDRYARGLPLTGMRVPIYNGEDDDMPDLQHLDLAEREEIIENAREEYNDIIREHDKKRKEKLKKIHEQQQKELLTKYVQNEKEKEKPA